MHSRLSAPGAAEGEDVAGQLPELRASVQAAGAWINEQEKVK